MNKFFLWLSKAFRHQKNKEAPEIVRARSLIKAIDKGGIPLNPARINAIARDLGLEVSKKAPVEETILRIRNALKRIY